VRKKGKKKRDMWEKGTERGKKTDKFQSKREKYVNK
jgi:hypothetical protein